MSLNRANLFILTFILVFLGFFLLNSSIFGKSTLTGHATTDAQVGNLSASVQTYVACTWSAATLDVDFGALLNPGTNDINATNNYIMSPGTGYNVTVDSLTTSNVDITISGNNLVDGGNLIGVGNVTWASSTTNNNDASLVPGSSTPLSAVSANVATNIAPESNAYYRFWLDIPSEVVAGNYVGNYTIQCEEA